MCGSVFGYAWRSAGARGDQKWLLELEFQAVVSHLMWLLGTELRSSSGAASTLNH